LFYFFLSWSYCLATLKTSPDNMEIIELDAETDVGKQRIDNQDNFICTKLWTDTQALMAVIDGVGGYEGGERAAAIAKESIERYMASPKGDVLSMLREAVVFANNRVNEEREKNLNMAQMCCVLTAAVADAQNHILYYVHVGDTRLYRFRNDELEKLTNDHSLVGLREDAGELTEAEAMQHPRRNVILRQVGSDSHRIDDPDFLEYGTSDFIPGDTLLVCSDGLSDMITSAQISAILRKQIPFPKKTSALIILANEMGGNDNITVVLAKNQSTQTPSVPIRKTPIAELSDKVPEEKQEVAKRDPRAGGVLAIIFIAMILMVMWGLTNNNIQQAAHKALPKPTLRLQRDTSDI